MTSSVSVRALSQTTAKTRVTARQCHWSDSAARCATLWGYHTCIRPAAGSRGRHSVIISSDDLVRRNAAFAATGAFAGLPFPGSDTLQVLGCVDSRVDPGDVLGLELSEGVVMRNIGGRITPATLRSWALLGRLGQRQPRAGTW